jgi:hypothetical protein
MQDGGHAKTEQSVTADSPSHHARRGPEAAVHRRGDADLRPQVHLLFAGQRLGGAGQRQHCKCNQASHPASSVKPVSSSGKTKRLPHTPGTSPDPRCTGCTDRRESCLPGGLPASAQVLGRGRDALLVACELAASPALQPFAGLQTQLQSNVRFFGASLPLHRETERQPGVENPVHFEIRRTWL